MDIYAISDLHLGFSMNKPMDRFGIQWKNHDIKIKEAWLSKIKPEDLVLLPGDISWAMKFTSAISDLNFIYNLTGEKIISKGNHDYWWQSTKKMQEAYPAFRFLHNNSFVYKDSIGICGTKGSNCPGSDIFSDKDDILYRRELDRLEYSLKSIKGQVNYIIVMLHYPPTNEKKEYSEYMRLIEKYSVNQVIYGHLHGDSYYNFSIKGTYNNVLYRLVSADFLDFEPMKIYENI